MHATLPDDLIGHLYDAAVDASLWQGVAERIARAFDSTSTVVKFHGSAGDVELLETTDNLIVYNYFRKPVVLGVGYPDRRRGFTVLLMSVIANTVM